MKLTDRILYQLIRLLLDILGCLPRTWRETCAIVMGRIGYRLFSKHRNIAINNLSAAFGSQKSKNEIAAIAKNVFVNLARMPFEMGWANRLNPRQWSQHFKVSGLSVYERAVAKGNGVILLSAHFSNWELLVLMAHMVGMTPGMVYRQLDAAFLERIIFEMRSRFGGVPIPNNRGAMRKLYASLRKGGTVALLMDQNVDWYEGVFVEFFNRRACTNIGLAALALKSNAPVIPFFAIREKDGFHGILGPELPLIRTGDRTKDIEQNTLQCNQVIEAYARLYPDQWFWLHQRWKTKPYCPWPR